MNPNEWYDLAAISCLLILSLVGATFGADLTYKLIVKHTSDLWASLAAFLINTVAGGVFMMKVKVLSANAVMTTGIGRPGSMPCVWALNALQNSMMFNPR